MKKSIILATAISVLVLTGTALGVYFGVFYTPGEVDNDVVLTLIGNENTETYTLTEIKTFDNYTGYGGTKNAVGTIGNYNQYVGVPILSLLDDIGGMTGEDYYLRVTASDNYIQDYTYSMINGNVTTYDNQTGVDLGYNILNMVLIYEIVGEGPVTDGPLRIAYLSPEGYLTDSNLWVKLVVKIELIPISIALTLIGNGNTKTYTLDEILAFENYTGYGGTKNSIGNIANYNQYVGVPILSLLDDIGGMTTDYILRATASDDYTQDYTYSMVNGNVTTYDNQTGVDLGYNVLNMVLIYEIVGEGPVTDGPLRIAFLSPVGYLTDSNLWAKLVVKLELILV